MKRALVIAIAVLAAVPAWAGGDQQRAARMLAEWRIDEARPLIARLAETSPHAPETRYLRAELAFLDGDYAAALAHLGGLSGASRSHSSKALRELVTRTMSAVRGFAHRPSPAGHFDIWYQPGKDEVIVELAGEALDRAYDAMKTDFGVAPSAPVRVEFVTRPADLAKVSTLTEKDIRTTGTIALCKYNKLMAVTPRATLFGYAWLDTLTHEYVHFVVSTATRDRVPVWLQEGLARFEQDRWRMNGAPPLSGTDEYLLGNALEHDSFVTFAAMYPSMAKLPSQEAAALAYAQVFTLVRYVHEQVGYEGLRRVLAAIRSGVEARDAVAHVLRARSWRAVEVGWKQALRDARLTPDPALANRARHGHIRFDDGGQDTDNVGISELDGEKARGFARLGGLLRARGMAAAAAIEYEKALALTGPREPFVAAKLARTYLALGKYERAIELAEPLLSSDENDAAPATTLGLAYQAAGEPVKAIAALEAAVRVNPFDPAVRCALAEAHGALHHESAEKRERDACRRLSQ